MKEGNKMLFPLGGKTVLETTVQQILEASPGELIVVLGRDASRMEALLAGLPLKTLINPHFETGMTGSIQAGVIAAAGNGLMICLGDMTLIGPREYQALINAFEERYRSDPRCICVPVFGGHKGNPVIFSSLYREEILDNADPEGCREIIKRHPANQHLVEMSTDHILVDMDSPEDYRRILKRVQGNT